MEPQFGYETGHLGIELINEKCEAVKSDASFNLNKMMQIVKRNSEILNFRLIDTIDEYGYTIFNQIQIPIFINELNSLLDISKEESIKRYIMEIRDFTKEAQGQPGIFIRFIGD